MTAKSTLFVCLLLLTVMSVTGVARRAASAPAQRTQRGARRATPTPTPVIVPRLPPQTKATPRPSPTPPRVVVAPSQDEAPPVPRRPIPTPMPTQPGVDAIDEGEVVRVTSNLVVVPVAVTDASGEAVEGLKLEDFRLEEEGRAQQLAAVGSADQVPLDIAIVFDVSSSVTKNFDFEKQSAAGFLKEVLKPADRAAVFTIAERPRMVQPLAPADAATARLVSIAAAERPTGTAFYDTVGEAARYLAQNAPERHRRVILVISDGEDNFSDEVRDVMLAEGRGGSTQAEAMARQRGLHSRAVQKVLREVQRADAVFYSINPSGPGLRLNVISQRAQDQMRQLAETTGGTAFVPDRLESLGQVFRQIAAELRAQYLLQYLSNNDAPAGEFLSIRVLTPPRPGLRVRARQGYYAAGK